MIFGIADADDDGKSDIIGNVAIAVTLGCSACATMNGGGLIIDDISVLMTGNPIKPVFVIISP